jgi:hypothetical protein
MTVCEKPSEKSGGFFYAQFPNRTPAGPAGPSPPGWGPISDVLLQTKNYPIFSNKACITMQSMV